jgi:hypothetical protein
MLYRIVRAVREGYGFAAFALFGGLFLLAAAMVFFLPVGSVVLLLGSLLLLVGVWMGSELLGWLERVFARPALRRLECPICGGHLARTPVRAEARDAATLDGPIDPLPEVLFQCTACPAMFDERGEQYLEDPDFRPAAVRLPS